MKPSRTPLGLQLAQTARTVSRAFDEALTQAGGSLPTWLVLLNLKIDQTASQRELAHAVGIREPTLSHHLNGMEADGLVQRRRDPANRRVHIIELTPAGELTFTRLRRTAMAFDQRLRGGLSETELNQVALALHHLADNVSDRTVP